MIWRVLVIAGLVTLLQQMAFGRPDLLFKDFLFGGIPLAIAACAFVGPAWASAVRNLRQAQK